MQGSGTHAGGRSCKDVVPALPSHVKGQIWSCKEERCKSCLMPVMAREEGKSLCPFLRKL